MNTTRQLITDLLAEIHAQCSGCADLIKRADEWLESNQKTAHETTASGAAYLAAVAWIDDLSADELQEWQDQDEAFEEAQRRTEALREYVKGVAASNPQGFCDEHGIEVGA